MKKSVLYQLAMLAVVDSKLDSELKLDVLEVLMNDKSTAEWSEKREEEAK